jgi:hypothetical protein
MVLRANEARRSATSSCAGPKIRRKSLARNLPSLLAHSPKAARCYHSAKKPGTPKAQVLGSDGMGPSAIAKDELIASSQILQWDRCTLCSTANVSHVEAIRATRPQRKGPPERPMVPKASKAFSLAIALPCDASSLLADWLAAAGLMLALHWPSGPWPLDAGLWTLIVPLQRKPARKLPPSWIAENGS